MTNTCTCMSVLVSSDPQCPNTQGGQLAPPQHWMTTQTMSHYMKYAMASYGWPLFVFADLSSGLCKLCGQCRYVYLVSVVCSDHCVKYFINVKICLDIQLCIMAVCFACTCCVAFIKHVSNITIKTY